MAVPYSLSYMLNRNNMALFRSFVIAAAVVISFGQAEP